MARRSAFKKTKRLYVISTEGAKTEQIYFSELHPGRNGNFRLKILGNPNHKSRPIEVLNRLLEYERCERPGPNTEYWAIIDRDSWSEYELNDVSRRIRERSNYNLAMSNPCFELWLWLHLKPNRPFFDRHDCQSKLSQIWPEFTKGDYDATEILHLITTACDRAKECDVEATSLWPRNQTSHIYKLIEKLR